MDFFKRFYFYCGNNSMDKKMFMSVQKNIILIKKRDFKMLPDDY